MVSAGSLRRSLLFVAVGLTLWNWSTAMPAVAAPSETLSLDEEAAFQAAADRVAGSIVRIEAATVSEAGLGGSTEANPGGGPSSGIIVDREGWILTTSFAVPKDSKEAIVILTEDPAGPTRKAAKVVGRDLSRGLVLLKIETAGPLPVPEWVSRDQLAAGQWTIAISRSLDGAVPSLAVGILSATNRAWGKAVQTDASISPSNYGGALLDIQGRVIGILAALPADTAGMNLGTELYDSGIGFAVPLEEMIRVLPRLKKGETLAPGILGISYKSRDIFTAEAVIATVRAGSPAARADLQAGDTVVCADGRPVTRIAELRHALTPRYAGDTLDLVVERRSTEKNGSLPPLRLEKSVTLVESLPVWRRPAIGIVPVRTSGRDPQTPLADKVEETAGKPDAKTVAVAWVWPKGPAAQAGILAGDVIESLKSDSATSSQPLEPLAIESPATLAGIVGGMEIGTATELTILRDKKRLTLKVIAAAMPADLRAVVPAAVPTLIAKLDPLAPLVDAATISKLEAAEVAKPPLVVLPTASPEQPLGILVYFGAPHGPVEQAEAVAWKAAAARYGVAVVLPGSGDPQRWSREDIATIARSLDSLRSRRSIDPTRVAVAGRGAGGAFAWLVADALGPAVRGAALLDSALPRQTTVELAEPGQSRWVLFGSATPHLASKADADRKRLTAAGFSIGELGSELGETLPSEILCAWIESLGIL